MAKPVKHYGGWRLRWVDERGNRRSETVRMSYKDAEFLLRQRESDAEKIRRGLAAPIPEEKTFDELADYYLTHFSVLKRRYRDDESLIRVHLRPAFGKLKLAQVADHVDTFKSDRKHLNKKTLHNQLTLLITMLRVAHEKNWLPRLPNIKKPRLQLFDEDFNYLRTQDEISRVLLSARDEGELVYTLYSTATYTGLREGELAGLRWDDVNFERRLIAVQRSYDGPTKNGSVRYVPILDVLLPVLREWRLKCAGRYVFPNEAGNMQQHSARVFQEVLYRVLDRAEFPKIQRNGRTRRYIVFHDLRHTFASHWMMTNGNLFTLQKILGHKDPKMTMRYAHLAPDAFSADYGRFGSKAPGFEMADVLPLHAQPPGR